jgi:ferrous-iron efflux pump FieF
LERSAASVAEQPAGQSPNDRDRAYAAERAERAEAAHRAGRLAALVAAGLALGKLTAGQLGHSMAITASAVDSLMDVFASSANAVAIRLAHAQPDAEHPFGHAKIEALATAAQGVLIGGSGVYLLVEGVRRVLTPEPLRFATLTLGTMVVSSIITALLVAYLARVGKRTHSTAVAADAVHYRTDIGANLAVLVGVAATYLTGIQRIDGALSLLVSGYVLASALGLLRVGVRGLLDVSASSERRVTLVRALDHLLDDGTILGYHALRTRMAGQTMFVEIHIELPGDMHLREAHGRGDSVRDRILAADHDAQVLIHIDVERVERDKRA